MRVLIAGADGQIGRALAAAAPAGAVVLAVGRGGMDLTRPGDVAQVVRDARPDWIFNAAAYTAVDQAESEPALARAVNEDGARVLAAAAGAAGARMLQLSTDYVFDGRNTRPYRPDDRPSPLGVYGATKLGGERAVLETLGPRAVVLRTAWVYAATGRNFLRTMLRLLSEREQVSVVRDQVGTPTSAASVARAAWAAAAAARGGIEHWTDAGTASWYDFALAIQEDATSLGLLSAAARVIPISTEEYPTPARRPRYSVLDCSATRAALGLEPEPWRAELRLVLAEVRGG